MADDADRGLQDLLLERLAAEHALPDEVSDLVLAAWQGQDALDAALAGKGQSSDARVDSPDAAEQGQVFLAAIHVEGFRGIGKETTLPLRPGPGLTLVTGRNGSGKSSFAEGAEVALTGTSARWSGRSAVWKTGWRNLHSEADPKVSVDLVVSGQSKTTRITRTWADSDGVDEGKWTRQLQGQKVEPFDGAGWRDPMQTYRPFLSYGELGAVIDGKPTELHDALYSLLGLGALSAALDRLAIHRKAFDKEAKEVGAARRTLQADLAALDDQRAARAAALLKSTNVDLEAATALALGTDDDVAEIAQLRRLVELQAPDRAEVDAAVLKLRAAADTVAGLADDQSEAAGRIAALLRAAIEHHHKAGDGSCPVCGKGRLTAEWNTKASEQASDLEQSSGLLRVANSDLRSAVAHVRALTSSVPAALDGRSAVDTAAVRSAWQAWADAGRVDGPAALANAVETALEPLIASLNSMQTYAVDELTKRDELWQPYALQLSTWIGQAEQVRKDTSRFKAVADAEKWLKSAAADLRTQRMAPFADGSQRVWQRLRQQSNVELGPVRLEGSANRRQVAMDVSIDGASGGTALGVMSQGELHALGLSLFLPRATVDDSPFRFVMIDDPVQAMDPAKVDGLARVLAEVALTRQVIVFSHDDRLAEAVRRLETPATVWEVHRREHSVIELVAGTDAVNRYLDDARALAKSAGIPVDLRTELVASCCRSAIEAACQTKVRAVRLSRGESLVEVEAILAEAHKTTQKMSLAVFDDAHREGDLYVRLNRSAGPWAVDALKTCNKGAHFGVHPGELTDLVRDCMKLAQWVQK